MTDWTKYGVVRDKDNDPWVIGKYRLTNLRTDEFAMRDDSKWFESAYGPLMPVLDADGLPVVRTVGDLTARHIGKRVRVNGTVRNIISVAHTRDGSTVLHLQPGCLETASVAPCEVLDD